MVNHWVPSGACSGVGVSGGRERVWWGSRTGRASRRPQRKIGMRLTTSTIATLSLGDGEADRIWFDDEVPGFGLRIRNTGSRTWVYQYKIQRRTRRVVIGKVSAIKLAKAREIAADYHARVRQGGDPVTEKRVQIERASHTFGPLAEQYLERRKTALRPRSWTATALYLQKHAAPLHTLPVDSVNLRTIAGLLGRIEKTTGPVAANRCRAALSSMFSWAMREGLAQSNPTLNTNKREEHPRDHVLTNDEIRHVWAAAEGAYGDIIKLLILTGQRREEIGSLRWSEVNLDRKLISLPRERTKNARPHEIPISPTAASILSGHTRSPNPEREFVFGRRPFGGWSRSKQALDALLGDRVRPWHLHDLRRTAATGMADIGVQPHIIETVLNHQSGHKAGIAGIYNRSSYTKEKAEALARWDEHVASLVVGCGQ
jgi:integrase